MENQKQNNKCSLCGGSGIVEMTLPVPFSAGEVVERNQEACPACR